MATRSVEQLAQKMVVHLAVWTVASLAASSAQMTVSHLVVRLALSLAVQLAKMTALHLVACSVGNSASKTVALLVAK